MGAFVKFAIQKALPDMTLTTVYIDWCIDPTYRPIVTIPCDLRRELK